MQIQTRTLTLDATSLPDRNLISSEDDDKENAISVQNTGELKKHKMWPHKTAARITALYGPKTETRNAREKKASLLQGP